MVALETAHLGVAESLFRFYSIGVVKVLRCLHERLPRRVGRIVLHAYLASTGWFGTLFARLRLRLRVQITDSLGLVSLLAASPFQAIIELVDSGGLSRSEAPVRTCV